MVALISFCVATILLIPFHLFMAGGVFWLLSAGALALGGSSRERRNLGILLVCLLVLAFTPIHTGLSTAHFFTLGLPFLFVVLLPYLFMRWQAPGEVVWRLFPKRLAWKDIFYVMIAVPLSWVIIQGYFFTLTPDLAANWPLPSPYDPDAVNRLVLGINAVGIWDELFFINTVYVLLRGIYPSWISNLAQAVVYTSVLYTMAFTGAGPIIVYCFALTQGAMYERAGVLFYVLLVHLIIDVFLVLAILSYHYPDQSFGFF
jgi:hypothetical protein